MAAPAMLVITSPTAMRAEAAASISASGVRSPISHGFAGYRRAGYRGFGPARKARQRDGAVGHRHLPWTDHLILHRQATHAAIADRNQKRLRSHRGSRSTRSMASAMVTPDNASAHATQLCA